MFRAFMIISLGSHCFLTQINWLHYSQSVRLVLDLFTLEGWKAELTLVLAVCQDGLPVCRWSPV